MFPYFRSAAQVVRSWFTTPKNRSIQRKPASTRLLVESLEDRCTPSTTQVLDIIPGTTTSNPANLTNVNGTLFFTASTSSNGVELWTSDGTAAGTVLVRDINPGAASSNPANLTNVNGTLFFTASTSSNGVELWTSDGTATGTVMVKDIFSGATSSNPANLTNVNGTLFFSARDSVNGIELWTSDGTTAGTVMVKNIFSGATSSNPANLANVNGTLFFSASDGVNGVELWKSDGTAAGTVLVKDIFSGAIDSKPANLTNVNGTLFFTASTSSGNELWKSDGTAAGTVLVKDIFSGATSSNPAILTNVNGTLFFRADDGVNGIELWKSDGTSAGTVLVKDILTGSPSSNPNNLTNVNGTLFFSANTPGGIGIELWKSDGTSAGTVLVKDIGPNVSSVPSNLTNLNGTLLFSARDTTSNTELWKSDGTAAGTVLVKDIATGNLGSNPANLTNVNGTLFFTADDGSSGRELWKSDGIPDGANNPPTIVSNAAAVSANEGGTATNAGTFSDAQGNATVTITASIGTVTQNNGAGTWSWSLNAADGPAGPFTVTITATDNQNAAASTTFTYAINNVPPTISLSGNAHVNEGSPYTLNLGAVSDPGLDTITSYKVNWGDGTFSTFTGSPANTTATHTYADGPATQTHNVTVTDEDGTFIAGSLSVIVDNVAPTIALTGNTSVNEGSSYTLTLGAISDPGTDTVSAYSINWGDGNIENFSGNPANSTRIHTYADGPIGYTISVSLTDEDDAYANAGSLFVAVDNVAPTIAISGASNVNEGSPYSLTLGAVTDPGTDTVTSYIVYWGDGNSDTYSTGGVVTHTYADGTISRAITVDLVDEDGTFLNRANALSVTVNNVDPTATANSYTATQGIAVSGNVLTDGIADSDPAGANDPLTVIGYTQPANGTVTVAANGDFSYTPATTFSGTDSFTYTISDGDGGTATATVTIIVNARAAGSVATVIDTCLGGTALLITGTTAGDQILVEPGTVSGTLRVTVNSVVTTVTAPSGRIIVLGGDGDDNIQIAGSITNPAWLYGDAGNDRLNNGAGGGLLIGGDGNDDLNGGSGRDIMIGGQGADRLVGNANSDILIAGYTIKDNRNTAGHEDFWCHVTDEWNDTQVAFTTRVNNLRNGSGASGISLLNAVREDNSADQIDMLQGSSGDDWFIFLAGEDKVVGQLEAGN